MSDAEQAWRDAVRTAQDEVDDLANDYYRIESAYEALKSTVAALDRSTVDRDSTYETEVVRGHQLRDVVDRGVADIRQAMVDITNPLDDLRRALDFYHH